jgi:hypothetical protein
MEELMSFETSRADYQLTQRNILEHLKLYRRRYKDLKSDAA